MLARLMETYLASICPYRLGSERAQQKYSVACQHLHLLCWLCGEVKEGLLVTKEQWHLPALSLGLSCHSSPCPEVTQFSSFPSVPGVF